MDYVNDIIEQNGKTWKENNLEKVHTIPLDTLVEINYPDSKYHRMRMYVVHYDRDCDGTPIYSLGKKGDRYRNPTEEDTEGDTWARKMFNLTDIHYAFGEESLIVIKENK